MRKSDKKYQLNGQIKRKDTSKQGIRTVRQQTALFLIIVSGLLLYGCSIQVKDLRSSEYVEPIAESQLIELSVKSEYMGREMPFLLYLPKGYCNKKEYPVWYGLHGYSSDESMWVKNGITDVADQLIESGKLDPLIMVFPFIKDASFKEITADFEEDGKFEERNIDKFINEELVQYIDSHYCTELSAKGRAIGGFSMGGMIALQCSEGRITGILSDIHIRS